MFFCYLLKIKPWFTIENMKKFTKTIEDFVCAHCGKKVKGNGFTNHCPDCLWSKHVDVNPGDRAEECGGMMEPVAFEGSVAQYYVVQRCQVCGHERRNKLKSGDNLLALRQTDK